MLVDPNAGSLLGALSLTVDDPEQCRYLWLKQRVRPSPETRIRIPTETEKPLEPDLTRSWTWVK